MACVQLMENYIHNFCEKAKEPMLKKQGTNTKLEV